MSQAGSHTADAVVAHEVFVENLVCRGFSEEQIYLEMKAAFPKGKWQQAHVRRYIKRAYARFEHRFHDPENVAETRARLRVRMQQLEKAKAWAALAKIEELVARIDGAIAPTQHNVNVQSSMTPELAALFRSHVARVTGAVEQAMRELMADEDLRLRILSRAGELVTSQGALPEPPIRAIALEADLDSADDEEGPDDEAGGGEPATG